MLTSRLLQGDPDVQLMRDFIGSLTQPTTIVDFEETLQLITVRANTRLWLEDGMLAGFAYVDDYNNLWFELRDANRTTALEDALVTWGIACQRQRNAVSGIHDNLDASFAAQNDWQIALLQRWGFESSGECSLHYERSLDQPLPQPVLAPAFSIRPVRGVDEVEDLVVLHQATFGTENMTSEQRLAIMRAPLYQPGLDLVAVAPNGDLAAFCIGGFEDEERHIGYTDPVGTHPNYRRLGLAGALMATIMQHMSAQGALLVQTGTSSLNVGMQRLADSLGFRLVSETLWFSKVVE